MTTALVKTPPKDNFQEFIATMEQLSDELTEIGKDIAPPVAQLMR